MQRKKKKKKIPPIFFLDGFPVVVFADFWVHLN